MEECSHLNSRIFRDHRLGRLNHLHNDAADAELLTV
jgi:hypothetical protein